MPTVPSTPLSQKPALTPVLPTDRLIGLRTPQNQADATKRVGPVSYVDVAAAVRPLLNLTANNTPGTDKRVRFQTAAQLAAALDGGDCLDALDPTTLVLGGLAWVEFHATLGYGVTLRLLFDGNTRTPAGSGLYAFRTGDLVPGDLVPVRWVQVTGPESGVPSYLQRPSGYVFAVNELVRAYASGSATEQFFAALAATALPAPTVAAGDANWRAVAGSALPTAGGGAFRGAWATVTYALNDCILIPAGNANAGLFAYALAAHSATAPYDPTKWQLDPGQSTTDYTATEKTKLAGITGTNTGDETAATIKTKLGVTTLSGTNTGDQDISGIATNATAIANEATTRAAGDAALQSQVTAAANQSGSVRVNSGAYYTTTAGGLFGFATLAAALADVDTKTFGAARQFNGTVSAGLPEQNGYHPIAVSPASCLLYVQASGTETQSINLAAGTFIRVNNSTRLAYSVGIARAVLSLNFVSLFVTGSADVLELAPPLNGPGYGIILRDFTPTSLTNPSGFPVTVYLQGITQVATPYPAGVTVVDQRPVNYPQIGAGLAVSATGVVSATASVPVPATASTAGIVKIGTGISVAADGTISAASASATGGVFRGPWTASTAYAQNDIIISPAGSTFAGLLVYNANVAFTSPATFTAANWTLSAGQSTNDYTAAAVARLGVAVTLATAATDLSSALNEVRNTLRGSTEQAGPSYTLALTDAGNVVPVNSASAVTLTVPLNASVAFPTGTIINLSQVGAGQIVITAASGVTIRQADSQFKTAKQWAEVSLRKRAGDEWVLTGYTAA